MSLHDVKSRASTLGENLIFARETLYTRRFSSVKYSQWNTSREDSHTYEVLALHNGVYFYVDIDSYDSVRIDDIISSIRTLCQRYFDLDPTFQIASACSDSKQSFHVVSSLAFESISDAGSFAYVLNGMHNEVDMNVYKQHQNWRMLYQSKAGDPSRPFLPYGDSSTDAKDHLIGIYSSRGIFKNRFAGIERPVVSASDSVDIIEYLDMTIKADIPEYKKHMSPLEYVMSCIPNTGNGQPWIVWLYVGFALRNIQADLSLWIDWSNTWNNGDQTKQCTEIWNHMVPRNDGFNLGTLIKCANQYAPRRINETLSIGALDDLHGIKQKDCVYTETYVRPYTLPEGVTCLLERSQMGTGKTYQLFEYIKRHAPLRIIHMSARQDYTTSIHGDYLTKGIHMKHYLKDGTSDTSRIIIQMESLWKCQDADAYDLVVLDEIESLLKQWSSSHTMKGKVATNAQAFSRILRNASVVLGMDAFLSQKSVECLNQLGIPPYVRWNTFQPQSRVAIDCQSKGGLLGTLIACLGKGQKCVLFTASQQFGTDVLTTVNDAFPHISTRYYHSSVDDSVRDELSIVQDAWKSLDLLIYSPCITVGVNFDLPHFDTLFLYGSCMSTNIRDCFQSSMRARHIRTNECYYALHTKSPGEVPTSRDDIVEHIGNTVPFYNSTHACPRWLLNVHIHNIQEDNYHRVNYRDTWDYFLRTCGYTIVDAVVSDVYDISKDSPVVYSDIPDVPHEAVKEVEQAITHRNATSHVKRMFSKFVFDSYTCTDESDLEKSFVFDQKWKNKGMRKKMKNVSDELFSTPQHVAQKEMNNASFVEIAATHSRTSAFDTLKKIVYRLGVDHSVDSCSWFSLPDDKARTSRLINTWSGGTIVKAKKGLFRIKKKI